MRTSGVGRALFAVSLAGLALLCLAYGNFAPILEPFSSSLPWPRAWERGLALILLAASAGLFSARTATAGAATIAVLELAWVVVRAHAAVLKPLDVGSWYGVGEALGPLMGAWALLDNPRRARGRQAERVLFGAACVAYGAAHFAYAAYTAKMVPAWLPGRLGFVYFTGACHAAAGLGLMMGALARMAATLEAMMITLFGVLVWLPSFFSRPAPEWAASLQVRWSETLLTFLLAGSAWIIAASLKDAPRIPSREGT